MTGLTLGGFAGLVVASLVIIAIPGPSVMYLVGQALTVGRRPALVGVVGNAVGMGVVALLVAFGLSAVIARYSFVQPTLRLLGAAVLAGIGVTYLRTGAGGHGRDDAGGNLVGEPADAREVSATAALSDRGARRSALVSGFLVGVSNPKALVMFAALVPSFLTPGITPPSSTLMLMSAIPLITGLILDSLWVQAAAKARRWLGRSPKRLLWLNRLGGSLMLLMALYLLIETLR